MIGYEDSATVKELAPHDLSIISDIETPTLGEDYREAFNTLVCDMNDGSHRRLSRILHINLDCMLTRQTSLAKMFQPNTATVETKKHSRSV
jgi:hypothetical protein